MELLLQAWKAPLAEAFHHLPHPYTITGCSSLVSLETVQKQTKKIPLFSFRALDHQQDKTS